MRFDDISMDENITGFVCGSDTIFCIDEFEGFDDGYFANYEKRIALRMPQVLQIHILSRTIIKS